VNSKAWIIFAAICVALLGGLVILSRQGQVNVGNIDQSKIVAASAANGNIADHVFGNKSGKTLLIEYGDFQCPGCGAAYPILKDVTEQYKDKLTFVFRNNPLTTIHPNARAAAAAAEAAGLQGKYWEMHNMLYEKQNEWSESSTDQRLAFFDSYAGQVGVKDIKKFEADMDAKGVSDKINFDLALGKKVPVQGTPTILLNGKQIDSNTWGDKDKMKSAVEDALK
jgi:protein-disulfide isomerase